MNTWRGLIGEEMSNHAETWEDVLSCTLSDQELDAEFYEWHGGTNGKPFTLWTEKRVYFPVVSEGAEWVVSVSRNPDGKATDHVGGG